MGLQGSSELSTAFRAQIITVGEPHSLASVYRGPELAQHSAIRPRLSLSVVVHVPRKMLPDSGTRAARAAHAPVFTRCLHHPWSGFNSSGSRALVPNL